jgi:uncharacterized protein YdeI (YjbR/CyaY-like superfamily)
MKIDNLLDIRTREALRLWLQVNCKTQKYCWVVVSVTPRADTLLYLDVVEEALCFGWIDGIKKKTLDNQLVQRLSPRTDKSSWTELNKERVRRLEKLGLMNDSGREVLLNTSPVSFIIDNQIERRLKEDELIYENFIKFPELYRRIRIDTIQQVKNQPEIFQKRLDKLIQYTKNNKMYGQWNDSGRLIDY